MPLFIGMHVLFEWILLKYSMYSELDPYALYIIMYLVYVMKRCHMYVLGQSTPRTDKNLNCILMILYSIALGKREL
jgi:hypothetical protein